MNISQRQAMLVVLGFQLTALLLLWLDQLFAKPGSDLLTLGAGLASLVYGGMLFAYLRGWEYARHTSVVLMTLIVAAFLPEPFVTTYAPFLILLGPTLALVLVNPRWVIGSAAATIGILLLRAGGVGVYATMTTLLNYVMLIAGLVVSRMISDSTRLRAEQAEEALREMHDDLELQFQQRTTALAQANTLLETMLEYVPDQIYFKDAESRFIKNSKSQAIALGIGDSSQVIGKTDFDFFPHAQRSYAEEQEIIRSGQPLVDFEEQVTWPNGQETWVSTTKVPLRNHTGQIMGTFGISRDITERKRNEAALRKAKDELEVKVAERTTELKDINEQLQLELGERKRVEAIRGQLAAIVDSSDDAIIGKTLEGMITSWNSGAEQLYDYSAEEVIGRRISLLMPPDRPDELPEILTRLQRGESIKHYETMRLRKDGARLIVSLTISPIKDISGEITGFSTIARDITARRQAEEKLRESEERYRRFFENMHETFIIQEVIVDEAGKPIDLQYVDVNPAAERILGKTRDEIIGRTRSQLSGQPDPDGVAMASRVLSTGIPFHMVRYSPGYGGWFESFTYSLGSGQVATLSLDITDRKQAEEQVHFQANLLANINDAVIASNENNHITAWNSAAEFLYGWKAEEVLGQLSSEIVKTEFDEMSRTEVLEVLAETGKWRGEVTQARKDGSRFHVETASIALRNADEKITGYVSANRDITERKLAEQQIERQNQRLSVLREIDVAILAADSVESIISAALSHTRELIDCRRANLTLIDWETKESVIFDVSTVNETAIPKGRRFPLAQYQDVIQALSQNQLLLMNDLRALEDPRPAIQSLLKDGLQSLCSLPLSSQGNLIGMYSMYSEVSGYFDEEKINLGREVANQIALAITQKNLLEGLKDQQARTAGIINSAMDAIISVDVDQQIVLFNPAAEAMFQCGQADAIGQPVERFLPERFRMVHAKHIQQFAQTGVTSRAMGKLGTIYGLRRNGEEFPIEASISQTVVAGKSIFTVILRDITKRKHAEEALRQSQENFAKAFNSNLAAIAITRLTDGKFLTVNPAYLRIMEYEPEELLEHTAAEKNIYADLEERAQLVQQLREQGSVQNHELRIRVKSGEIRNIILSMQPILYNEEECILSVFVDISERKKTEAELQRSNTELEQFAYVASHDLQEPLRAVAGMVQLLQQRYKGKLDERADDYIGHAVEASGRMQSLINDLLDYSRVDRLGKPFSATNLERTLDLALANLQVAIQESGAQITRDPLPTVIADASQLTQVFQNLIGNAIKFRGKRVPQLHVSAEQVENGWRFMVRDNGIGIEPQYFERIFLVFQRLHTRREYSGTGIGLALCKKIIERHHGQIWVESQPEQGSVFYFTIPERSI